MFGDEDQAAVFEPWYEYLSTLEWLVHGVVVLAMIFVLWAGFTGRADMGGSIGIVLLFTGWTTFLTKWSVSQQRTASLTAFENN
jgi:hypothetical protein